MNAIASDVRAIVTANAVLRPFVASLEQAALLLHAQLVGLDGLNKFSAKPLATLSITLLEGHLPVLLNMTRATEGEELSAYPLLIPLVERSLKYWCDTHVEIFTALLRDRHALEREFGALSRFESISPPSGDFHQSGRSVRVLEFSGGRKLVFKPRSMKIDQSFQALLRWVNEKGLAPSLGTLNVLDRGDYGWTEFVSVAACATRSEVERFDNRVGALLAILHALAASDVHFQNILAAGEHPFVIDLETLFHRFPRHTESDARTASGAAYLEIVNSVTSVGLLSWPMPVGPQMWMDMGGLGGRFHPPGLQKRVNANNRPLFNGEAANVELHALFSGYQQAYQLMLVHRAELTSPQGPLAKFRANHVRVVIQGTYVYQHHLLQSYAGDALKSSSARKAYFEQGFKQGPPGVQQFAASEVAQLMNGDIPYFDIAVDGEELRGADGSTFKNVAGRNGWSTALERIAQLSANDLEKQKWFMSATVGFSVGPKSVAVRADNLHELTSVVAEHIASRALVRGDAASWIAAHRVSDLDDEPLFTVEVIRRGVCEGLTGLALFIQRAAQLDAQWSALERQIANALAEPRSPQSAPASAKELGAELFASSRSSAPSRLIFEHLIAKLNEPPSAAVLLGLREAGRHWPEAEALALDYLKRIDSTNDVALAAAALAFNENRLARALTPSAPTIVVNAIASLLIAGHLSSPDWRPAPVTFNRDTNFSLMNGRAGQLLIAQTARTIFGDRASIEACERLAVELVADLNQNGFASSTPDRTHALGLAFGLAGLGYAAASEESFDPWPLLLLS